MYFFSLSLSPSLRLYPTGFPCWRVGTLAVYRGAVLHERWSEASERLCPSAGYLRCAPVHGKLSGTGTDQHTLETAAGEKGQPRAPMRDPLGGYLRAETVGQVRIGWMCAQSLFHTNTAADAAAVKVFKCWNATHFATWFDFSNLHIGHRQWPAEAPPGCPPGLWARVAALPLKYVDKISNLTRLLPWSCSLISPPSPPTPTPNVCSLVCAYSRIRWWTIKAITWTILF